MSVLISHAKSCSSMGSGEYSSAMNSVDMYGRTPLHRAAKCGNWDACRLLAREGANEEATDYLGLTAKDLALKTFGDRSGSIPDGVLGIKQGSGGVQTAGSTLTKAYCSDICSSHFTHPIITVSTVDPPPENVNRLAVLLNPHNGTLRTTRFSGLLWDNSCVRAKISDVLRVHDYKYVEKITGICHALPDSCEIPVIGDDIYVPPRSDGNDDDGDDNDNNKMRKAAGPQAVSSIDPDTAVSRWSYEAAMRAAGSVTSAVADVVAGKARNAFCAVRPPGHHAGPRGVVTSENDKSGSHGFCLLNNVAIGAAYARAVMRDKIKKVAIIDFDVHHGNGTEACVRSLLPSVVTTTYSTPFTEVRTEDKTYKPWLDETDADNVFFASAHGYGPRDYRIPANVGGWFYPASGETHETASATNPEVSCKPTNRPEDFILTRTWANASRSLARECCKIVNCGLSLPGPNAVPGMQRVEMRDAYRKSIFPNLVKFDPDIIFISAGFDAHEHDNMNFGYVGMIEDDFEWVTENLVKIANLCCDGRVVSCLEGGYRIQGKMCSPFARSVAAHLKALNDGAAYNRDKYDQSEADAESERELEVVERREAARQEIIRRRREEEERLMREALATTTSNDQNAPATDDDNEQNDDEGNYRKKRRRPNVDYKLLEAEMAARGE